MKLKGNIVIISCKVPSEAYQILSMLRQDLEGDGYSISHAAIVKMNDGKLSMEDGFVASDAADDHTWKGGLIGSLVGILGGPLGVLLGGSVGALIGDSMDEDDLEGKSTLLEKASECLVDGETAVLLMAEEDSENALADKLRDFDVSITRIDATEIASEIENAEKEQDKIEEKKED